MTFTEWLEAKHPEEINEDWRSMLGGAANIARYLNERLGLLNVGILAVLGAAIGAKVGWQHDPQQILIAKLQHSISAALQGLTVGGGLAGISHSLIDNVIEKLTNIARKGKTSREEMFRAIDSAAKESAGNLDIPR